MVRKPKQIPRLHSDLPLDQVVSINLTNPDKPFRTRDHITARLGSNTAKLPRAWCWNGANVPQFFWSIFGISQHDPRAIIASGFHDFGCEDDETPQVVADANFAALLGPIEFNGVLLPGLNRWRVTLGYIGIRFYSVFVRPFKSE